MDAAPEGSLAASGANGALARGAATAEALTHGYHLAFMGGAAAAAVAALLSATLLRPKPGVAAGPVH